MCGKISKLMVKYPLSYGQQKYEFLQYFLLWAELSDDADMGTMCVASIVERAKRAHSLFMSFEISDIYI